MMIRFHDPTQPFVIDGDHDLEALKVAFAAWTLGRHGGNKSRAAKAMGIDRRSMYRLLQKIKGTAQDAPTGNPTNEFAAT